MAITTTADRIIAEAFPGGLPTEAEGATAILLEVLRGAIYDLETTESRLRIGMTKMSEQLYAGLVDLNEGQQIRRSTGGDFVARAASDIDRLASLMDWETRRLVAAVEHFKKATALGR